MKNSKKKYKVGDKVICPVIPEFPDEDGGPGWNPEMDDLIGKVGTIKEVCEGYSKNRYYVKFDKDWDNWFYLEKWLIPAEEGLKIEESKCSNYHIWTDNVKVVSVSDDETGLIAFARCHPYDSFDLVTGVEIAMDRLLEKIDNMLYTGPVFCANTDVECFSRGYIYNILKGELVDDYGDKWSGIEDPEDLVYKGVELVPFHGYK